QTVGLRYFNVFGKRQDPHSVYAAVIPIFVKSLMSGNAPSIFGDGGQTRDFTYINNVIEANLLSALAPETACGRAYNISFGENTSLLVLYDKLCTLLNRHVSPVFAPDRPGDIRHSLADISLAREHLGYNPKFSIDDGLARTIEWYVKHLG
ncbi:NAD-dependent epimerase/dehydratase family protein, partial [Myxococcota bacterium]|nr:NAD-dependent epimerase/dehydratase family protein [Myxococcota bacterium]